MRDPRGPQSSKCVSLEGPRSSLINGACRGTIRSEKVLLGDANILPHTRALEAPVERRRCREYSAFLTNQPRAG